MYSRVWALGIYTGNSESGIDYTSMYSLFSTQVILTKEGLSRIDEVKTWSNQTCVCQISVQRIKVPISASNKVQNGLGWIPLISHIVLANRIKLWQADYKVRYCNIVRVSTWYFNLDFQVLEAVFSYINMLRKIGPSERVYQEIKVSVIRSILHTYKRFLKNILSLSKRRQ